MSSLRHSQQGFTLMELMITVAVIGLLAAVAYPAYTDQVRKGRRAECRSGLLQSMQQQERFFTQFNTYASHAAAASTAKTKAFSGDTLANSVCTIEAAACMNGATAVALNQCVDLKAAMRSGNDPVSVLTLSSTGDKGCTFNGSAKKAPADAIPAACWP